LKSLRRTPASDAEANPASVRPRSEGSFSASAVGVISNYGDQYFNPALVRRIRDFGVSSIVYSGPIANLDEPMPLWNLIQSGEVQWVYGAADRAKDAPELGPLPAGPEQIEVNGIVFRHFAPGAAEGERVRLGTLQWPPPGKGRDTTIERAAAGTDARIIVIGSGLEYERWVLDKATGKWELYEQNVVGLTDSGRARITLEPQDRHVIVHPTSRDDYFSIIDPDQGLMLLVTS
jgi:hypothetical protein